MARSKRLELEAVGDLDNERRLRILGIIDKLRELGVGENVSLPQVRISRCYIGLGIDFKQACGRWRSI
jgi:hypothetical protein